jgi:hypothetical protein
MRYTLLPSLARQVCYIGIQERDTLIDLKGKWEFYQERYHADGLMDLYFTIERDRRGWYWVFHDDGTPAGDPPVIL